MLSPTLVDTPSSIESKTADGRDLVIFTGTVGVEYTGTQDGWIREQLRVPFDGIWTRVDQAAFTASLAAIWNGGSSTAEGWAVDNAFYAGEAVSNGLVATLRANVAVWGPTSNLLRVNYHATILGLYMPPTFP